MGRREVTRGDRPGDLLAPSNRRIDLKVKPGIIRDRVVEASCLDWRYNVSSGFRVRGWEKGSRT